MWTRWTHICANEDAEWSSHLWHGLIISYEVKDNLATIYKAASYSEKWESMSSQDVCAALLVTVKNWGYAAARGHESLNENLHTSHRIPPRSLQSNIGYYHCSWLLTITRRQDSLAEDSYHMLWSQRNQSQTHQEMSSLSQVVQVTRGGRTSMVLPEC